MVSKFKSPAFFWDITVSENLKVDDEIDEDNDNCELVDFMFRFFHDVIFDADNWLELFWFKISGLLFTEDRNVKEENESDLIKELAFTIDVDWIDMQLILIWYCSIRFAGRKDVNAEEIFFSITNDASELIVKFRL